MLRFVSRSGKLVTENLHGPTTIPEGSFPLAWQFCSPLVPVLVTLLVLVVALVGFVVGHATRNLYLQNATRICRVTDAVFSIFALDPDDFWSNQPENIHLIVSKVLLHQGFVRTHAAEISRINLSPDTWSRSRLVHLRMGLCQ